MGKKDDEKFSQAETKKRFEAALFGARVAGHKSKKDLSSNLGKAAPSQKRKTNKRK